MKRKPLLRSTVPKAKPPKRSVPMGRPRTPAPPKPAPRVHQPRPTPRPVQPRPPKTARPEVARIMDDAERSLVDVIDNLLNSGVMLNADIILALANVDLVYLRLSALLCAADRVLPDARR